ncbi:hypothetical protein M9458_017201, partial [Cirrhinus mrigala]
IIVDSVISLVFLGFTRDRIADPTSQMNWAEDYLLEIQQGGRSLEEYVEELLSVFDQ